MHLTSAEGTEMSMQLDILTCLREHLCRVYSSPNPPREEDVIQYLQYLTLPQLQTDLAEELDADLTL